MRKLFLLSGPSASGKSTFIKENNLEPYTISSDDIRLLYGNPSRNDSGELAISQVYNKKVFNLIDELLDIRMSNGETTFVDATNLRLKDTKNFVKLAKKHFYKIYVVKFGRDLTIEELIERDLKRGYKKVGESVIKKQYDRMVQFDLQLTGKMNAITPEECIKELDWKTDFLDEYKKIVVIGDVHSSATVLKKALENYSEENFYIFLGDYFDRGSEAIETMKILQELLLKDNIVFLQGNHEKHLFDFVAGNKIRSNDAKKTVEELCQAGYTKNDISRLLKKLQPLFIANYNSFDLLFTHAGVIPSQFGKSLDDFKKQLCLRNESEFTKGLGKYDFPLVTAWAEADIEVNQYYGHRNVLNYEVIEDSNAFCLEQNVEHGGKLGVLEIVNEGFECISGEDKSIVNDIHAKNNTIATMRKHKFIRSKDIGNGVSVLNFSNKAFYKKHWDEFTVKARGLFVSDDNRVLARGYDKFFNINERPETQLDVIVDKIAKLNAPYTLTRKENGFLAIVSYIPELGGLQVFSKGADEWFSNFAKDQIADFLNYHTNGRMTLNDLEKLLKSDYKKGLSYSITFEICNSDIDPHIVYYNRPLVYLLDVIVNDVNQTFLENKAMDICNQFNFYRALSRQSLNFTDKSKIEHSLMSKLNSTAAIEGYILTLADGTKYKIKNKFYTSRKELRKYAEMILFNDDAVGKILEIGMSKPNWIPILNLFHKMYENNQVVFFENERFNGINIPKTLLNSDGEIDKLLDEL